MPLPGMKAMSFASVPAGRLQVEIGAPVIGSN
jgi:hypothetical protein